MILPYAIRYTIDGLRDGLSYTHIIDAKSQEYAADLFREQFPNAKIIEAWFADVEVKRRQYIKDWLDGHVDTMGD
jgi:hypothetical protein